MTLLRVLALAEYNTSHLSESTRLAQAIASLVTLELTSLGGPQTTFSDSSACF